MITPKKLLEKRSFLRYLHHTQKIDYQSYQYNMSHNLHLTKPWYYADLYIHILGYILITAGLICLVAFNWFQLSQFTKLALVETLLITTFGAMILSTTDKYKAINAAIFSVVIGLFWAVFGQIYQINSSAYHFTLVWAISLLPFAIVLRQQFTTALSAFLIYSSIYLYLSQTQLFFSLQTSIIFSVISALFVIAFLCLKNRNIQSFGITICSIFGWLFILSLFSILIEHILFSASSLLKAGILTLASAAMTMVFLYLRAFALMIALYLFTVFTFLISLLTLSVTDGLSLASIITIASLIIIYPTYLGAIWLLNYAKKVHQHD